MPSSFPRAALAALTLALAACAAPDAPDVGSSADFLTGTGAAGAAAIGAASYPIAGVDKQRLADELVVYTRTGAQVSCPPTSGESKCRSSAVRSRPSATGRSRWRRR